VYRRYYWIDDSDPARLIHVATGYSRSFNFFRTEYSADQIAKNLWAGLNDSRIKAPPGEEGKLFSGDFRRWGGAPNARVGVQIGAGVAVWLIHETAKNIVVETATAGGEYAIGGADDLIKFADNANDVRRNADRIADEERIRKKFGALARNADEAIDFAEAIAKVRTLPTDEKSANAYRKALQKSLGFHNSKRIYILNGKRYQGWFFAADGTAIAAEAHHIFPIELWNTPVGRRLRALGIDLNSVYNGVILPNAQGAVKFSGSIHNGPHPPEYLKMVQDLLENAQTAEDAIAILDEIRNLLLNNPGLLTF
jgi:hypothetical protein